MGNRAFWIVNDVSYSSSLSSVPEFQTALHWPALAHRHMSFLIVMLKKLVWLTILEGIRFLKIFNLWWLHCVEITAGASWGGACLSLRRVHSKYCCSAIECFLIWVWPIISSACFFAICWHNVEVAPGLSLPGSLLLKALGLVEDIYELHIYASRGDRARRWSSFTALCLTKLWFSLKLLKMDQIFRGINGIFD